MLTEIRLKDISHSRAIVKIAVVIFLLIRQMFMLHFKDQICVNNGPKEQKPQAWALEMKLAYFYYSLQKLSVFQLGLV